PRETERLETEDRKDAGHQVEDQPAEDRAAERGPEQRPVDPVRRPRDRLARRGHRAWLKLQRQAATAAQLQQRRYLPGLVALGARFDDDLVTVAAETLRRGIIDHILRLDEQVRRVDRGARGERDREAHHVAATCPP